MGSVSNIFELKLRLNNFLKEHPELVDYQRQIEKTLNLYGDDPVKRCRALEYMMRQKLVELQEKLNDLRSIVRNR